MIKHIFCDLDGTLFHNGVLEQDCDEIKKIQEEKVIFHIATGRIFNQAQKIIEDKVNIKGYYICENGSFIHNNSHDIIFKGTIDDNIIRKIISRFESSSASLYFKYKGNMIITENRKDYGLFTNDFIVDEEFINKKSFDNMIGNVGIISTNKDELFRIEAYYKSEFGDILDVYETTPHTINMVSKVVSKRKSIEYVCDLLEVGIDEIATIGDSSNDICMLKDVKYSFVMNRANEEIKRYAKYRVDNVSQAIQKIRQINNQENL